jgi:hypothetical protein
VCRPYEPFPVLFLEYPGHAEQIVGHMFAVLSDVVVHLDRRGDKTDAAIEAYRAFLDLGAHAAASQPTLIQAKTELASLSVNPKERFRISTLSNPLCLVSTHGRFSERSHGIGRRYRYAGLPEVILGGLGR